MCSDVTLGLMVNVLGSEDKKSDIYKLAGEHVIKKLTINLDPKHEPYRKQYEKLDINRKIMKIPVMTTPYNISLDGATDLIYNTIVKSKFYENKKYYYAN